MAMALADHKRLHSEKMATKRLVERIVAKQGGSTAGFSEAELEAYNTPDVCPEKVPVELIAKAIMEKGSSGILEEIIPSVNRPVRHMNIYKPVLTNMSEKRKASLQKRKEINGGEPDIPAADTPLRRFIACAHDNKLEYNPLRVENSKGEPVSEEMRSRYDISNGTVAWLCIQVGTYVETPDAGKKMWGTKCELVSVRLYRPGTGFKTPYEMLRDQEVFNPPKFAVDVFDEMHSKNKNNNVEQITWEADAFTRNYPPKNQQHQQQQQQQALAIMPRGVNDLD
jgi:hypothetical protein